VKNKETGEFELVVGNGQIISGFFILVLLLAVFFAMGFIVARAKYQQEPATTTASSTPPELRQQPAASQPPVQPPADTRSDSHADDATKPPVDGPAGSAAPPAAPPAAANPEPPPVVAESMQGTYWQVTATKDPAAARAMLQSMKDMGLPASLSPGPNDFTRVLVGPYSDNATMAKVKTQLENAGLHPVKHTQ
jgi:cell division septation protein DedD